MDYNNLNDDYNYIDIEYKKKDKYKNENNNKNNNNNEIEYNKKEDIKYDNDLDNNIIYCDLDSIYKYYDEDELKENMYNFPHLYKYKIKNDSFKVNKLGGWSLQYGKNPSDYNTWIDNIKNINE